ncbi:hypothetical protein CcaCcLH18_05075 [Colletotrichum camelliae]|nr:hypothetical protein CcaCcLH18_05075 [Colletotrichum camelliae]
MSATNTLPEDAAAQCQDTQPSTLSPGQVAKLQGRMDDTHKSMEGEFTTMLQNLIDFYAASRMTARDEMIKDETSRCNNNERNGVENFIRSNFNVEVKEFKHVPVGKFSSAFLYEYMGNKEREARINNTITNTPTKRDNTPYLRRSDQKRISCEENPSSTSNDDRCPPATIQASRKKQRCGEASTSVNGSPTSSYHVDTPRTVTDSTATRWFKNDFAFNFGQDGMYYFLRCPRQECENRSFGQHPLMYDRALSHFRSCGYDVKSDEDLIRQFALLVVRHRMKNKPLLNNAWIGKHNSNIKEEHTVEGDPANE